MRNGHNHNHNQNKRMRGRNNNRRGHNPLTRVYESNGPDVKIRGTAHHIAEKYVQLARDAQSSGDPVSAEGYLQHAEHYFRMIVAAQAQFAQQNPNQPQQQFQRPDMEGRDDLDDEGDESGAPDQQGGQPFQGQQGGQNPRPQPQPQHQPQPNFQGYPQGEQNEAGLPAFITGGGAPQGNGQDHEQGDGRRFDRNRNRGRNFRPRNNDRNFEQREPREQQGGEPQAAAPATDAPKQPNE